ncbi:MAG: hypothetical protein ACYDBB_03205 [Armatimonadota bacterium]
MIRNALLMALLCLLLWCGTAQAQAFVQPITLTEQLGHNWTTDLVHQTVSFPAADRVRADGLALYLDGKSIPMQLDNVVTNKDGFLTKADVWFRADLPANGSRSFELRSGKAARQSDLKVTQDGGVLEISNACTAVRLPNNAKTLVGPLLGVKLASGQWAGASQIACEAALESCTTEVLAQGPIFVRARVTYRFAGGGSYQCGVMLRSNEPLVRFDEQYGKAGKIAFDLGTNLQPTKFSTKASFRGNMQLTPINYDKPTQLVGLVGWDFYLPSLTSVIGYLGGPNDDLLGWVSTEDAAATWLPNPYQQTFTVTSGPGGKLQAAGSLENGRRAWAFLIGKGADFPDPGNDLYRWWNKHLVVSLDKVVNWQLVWPGMEKIEFPHTFFSGKDLPDIRARLQAEPAIQSYMEDLRKTDGGYLGWSYLAGGSSKDREAKLRFETYRDKYKPRGGIAQGASYISAGYIYFGDHVYLEQLGDKGNALADRSPEEYLDYFVKCYLDDIGILAGGGAMGNMNVSDAMLLRCVALDVLLGSDVLTPQEKRKFLTKLAFMTYVMHLSEWQPPVHMPDGSRPAGYGQGTPNQKHCAFSCRAITACMLANHPMKKEWMRFAMDELRPHYSYTIADSGALLESPFYSARDTMRYAPFWSAMTRAGVAEVAPDYQEWMNRPKKAFAYLANMLTPKEPRMSGKRVYHPIGRSSPGVVDPTFMIGADPWGLDDPEHAALMRWSWEQQGKPSPDTMGSTGGRNIALTLISFGHPATPPKDNPLHSRRYEGMGAIFRSHPTGNYESNVLFRHDVFCWDLYAVNNGAVYFYGKGAPLLPRFGGYWSHSYGGAWMMDMPFGNRVDFANGNNNCFGSVTEFASLGQLADLAAGSTDDKTWARSILFSKDLDHDDPVYLLVRDDVNRPGSASWLNWWVMTSNVAPDGLTKPGVVPIKISHEDWVRNLGKNWENALKARPPVLSLDNPDDKDDTAEKPAPLTVPVLKGQFHHFPGMCGVDVDLFIATPSDPQIITDAASTGQFPYCQAPGLYETQQLVRIAQVPGKGYLTLLVPRWPGSETPKYRTLAGGVGVAISMKNREDRLFLAPAVVTFTDDQVTFEGRAGFARVSTPGPLRLMVAQGRISAKGITLTSVEPAALLYDGKSITVFCGKDVDKVEVKVVPALQGVPVVKKVAP